MIDVFPSRTEEARREPAHKALPLGFPEAVGAWGVPGTALGAQSALFPEEHGKGERGQAHAAQGQLKRRRMRFPEA